MINFHITNEKISGIYKKEDNIIIPLHNCFTGKENYVLALIEQLIGNLNQTIINDGLVCFLIDSLADFVLNEECYYDIISELIDFKGYSNKEIIINKIKSDFSSYKLCEAEMLLLKNVVKSLKADYMLRTQYNQCDYGAMKVLLETLYYFLTKKTSEGFYKCIEIITKGNDEFVIANATFSNTRIENIIFSFDNLDRINHYSQIIKSNCPGLEFDSIEELATADMLEERYFSEDDKYHNTGSLRTIAQTYCAVIEQEINKLVQIYDLPNKPTQNLMWKRLKEYVKDNGISLDTHLYDLNSLMDDLHYLRNYTSHGNTIDENDYKILQKYKNQQLFEVISWTKMRKLNEKN